MKFKTRLKPSSNLINLTPLVDVVFLMLIFFIITSDILPLKSLNIENPTLSTDSAPLTTQLLVVIDSQNVIYLGSKKAIVDNESLKDRLAIELDKMKKHHPRSKPTIVLSIDRQVDYGSFIRIFSIAQQSGARIRLAYRTNEDT
jgi:biopolymer transport protein ExbD